MMIVATRYDKEGEKGGEMGNQPSWLLGSGYAAGEKENKQSKRTRVQGHITNTDLPDLVSVWPDCPSGWTKLDPKTPQAPSTVNPWFLPVSRIGPCLDHSSVLEISMANLNSAHHVISVIL
jgi:hypothetical protein